MENYSEWYRKLSDTKPLNRCVVYKQTRLERLLARTLPYCIPFISKRRRVAIRNYWKCRYARRASTALCKLLKNHEWKPPFPLPQFNEELYEWEVIMNKD